MTCSRERLLEQLELAVLAEVAERGQVRELELVAADGGELEQLDGVLGEHVDATRARLAHAVGDVELVSCARSSVPRSSIAATISLRKNGLPSVSRMKVSS